MAISDCFICGDEDTDRTCWCHMGDDEENYDGTVCRCPEHFIVWTAEVERKSHGEA